MLNFVVKQTLPYGPPAPDLDELPDILRDEMKLINAPGQGVSMIEFTGPLAFDADERISPRLVDEAVRRSLDRYMKRSISKAIESSAHESKPTVT
jgi:environmental stress-induced protein Ves